MPISKNGFDAQQYIQRYEPEIKKVVFWYARLLPGLPGLNVDELMQAGRLAVWDVGEKHPEKIDYIPYVKAAIRHRIINEINNSKPRIKDVHLVRREEGGVQLIDVLPVYDRHEERLADLDEILGTINRIFSKEEANSLADLVGRSDKIFDLNLTALPSTELKRKVGLVTKMGLDDEEIVVYANVLLGAIDRFPRGYIVGNRARARKYIGFLLSALEVSPEDFALSHSRLGLLREYRLDSFYQKVYNQSMPDLFGDIFPDIEPHQIRGRHRWEGRQGLINGYNAIDWVKRKTGKKVVELRFSDFERFQTQGFFSKWIKKDWRIAIEFRYPGTYPELSGEAAKLWSIFKSPEILT